MVAAPGAGRSGDRRVALAGNPSSRERFPRVSLRLGSRRRLRRCVQLLYGSRAARRSWAMRSRTPRRTLPRAVVWGGIIAGTLYVAVTIAVLLAMPANEIGAVQGIMQAADRMAGTVGVASIVAPLALILTIAVAGTTSAWVAGSARIPFVAGLDNYLPRGARSAAPAVCDAARRTRRAGRGVVRRAGDGFCRVDRAGGLQDPAPAGDRRAAHPVSVHVRGAPSPRGRAGFQACPLFAGDASAAGDDGSVVTALGLVVAFVPPGHGESDWVFEAKMSSARCSC